MTRLDRFRARAGLVGRLLLLSGFLMLVLPAFGTQDGRSVGPSAGGAASSDSDLAGDEQGLAQAGEPSGLEEDAASEAEPPEPAVGAARADRTRLLRTDLDGVVSPGSAGYLLDAVEAAETGDYEALLVVMDTPGGLLDSTRDISRAFLEAEVPVIVYVFPTGARAASAGMFITMSAHVAAMAPGTRIGAAAPVALGGGEEEEGSTMDMKVVEDTAAFARSVAEETNRNPEWAEKAVREAVSATAPEALELDAVDLIAGTVDELLDEIDGRRVMLHDGRQVSLSTADAEIEEHSMTIQQRVLMILGNPNISYVLLMLGLLGLMMELYNPGLIFPAAIGLFLLLLAGIGLNLLPVNLGGIILIVIAIGLIVAEIYVTAYGILALLGVGIMVLGSALLMDAADPEFFVDPSLGVSWGVILPTVILVAGAAIGLALYIVWANRRRVTTGHEGLEGEIGKARTDVGPEGGSVFVHGEIWRARSEESIPAGAAIVVTAVIGLQLQVKEKRSGE